MGKMRILLTGGYGKLGTELRKLRKFDWVPTKSELNITDSDSINSYILNKNIDLIVHAAALPNTNTKLISLDKLYDINVYGAKKICSTLIPVLFISTEYVFDGVDGNYNETDLCNPINHYGATKVLGELIVLKNNGKIIRSGRISLNPWPYDSACQDMYTSGDYIEIMAKEINLAISLYNKLPNVIHIGTERKSVLELAKRTNPNVREISRSDLDSILPRDSSFDIRLWQEIKKRNLGH